MPDESRWKIEVVFAGSCAKREGEKNEDFFKADVDRLRFAVSDGASVSYDSATWAALLCDKYIDCPTLDAVWIAGAVRSYNSTVNRDALPWMKQAAFDQGSFASLLGLTVNQDAEKIDISAVGDSNVLIMKDGIVVEAFPIADVVEFSRSPNLLCTVAAENAYLTEHVIRACQRSFNLSEVVDGDEVSVLMASDALCAWVMTKETDIRLNDLFSIANQEQFTDLVRNQRLKGDLKVDDTTMITIWIRRDLSSKH